MRLAVLLMTMLLGLPIRFIHAGENAIPVREKSGATWYIAGQIAGHGATEFLIDTGASFVAIDGDLLKTLERTGRARFLRRITGSMADGRRRPVHIYRIDALVLGENCWLSNVEAAALPGNTRNILGLSALRRAAPFTLSIDPPTITLNGCERPPA